MPTRTISITEEAYNRLSSIKESHDSFSDIILRITGKVDLLDFAGVLTEEEANKIEERIKENRMTSRKRLTRVRKVMADNT